MSETAGEPAEYGLVMPFIVCQSNGGPYEDSAFIAGGRFQQISALLESGCESHDSYQPPALVPQLDLLAMQHGYVMGVDEYDEHWSLVTFERKAASDE